jgi:quinol monooxygenase YgiN
VTILVIGTVRLPPENIDRARAAMETMVAASRAEDGCIEYAYAHDLLEPGLVRVNEAWRDRAALVDEEVGPETEERRRVAREGREAPAVERRVLGVAQRQGAQATQGQPGVVGRNVPAQVFDRICDRPATG